MREVRACDFCGEAAAGVFEVLPTGVAGDEPKRMVLCGACEETLAGVVDPLLDARPAADEPLVAEAEPTGDGEMASEAAAENHDGVRETEDEDAAADVDAVSDDDEDVHEAGGRPTRNRSGTPKGYSKVMRFLEGREFPMEREAAEEMVAEAYELDPATVSAAIDHAAKHGRVRVASGKLFR
ncbi:hypothetical protein N0B31_18115 [Salinirubellus salinus]|uniref:Uncharacterized protein n=1 Tax=Salinirubellus salinus TaxID=1364945 RepID=A0A9E7R2G3_9EURY|nr:hypothetical protein [Salinirubellus salinus]UWM54024.1 hypothetical protein N0B31_18115 [Salinirubellus salinus]